MMISIILVLMIVLRSITNVQITWSKVDEIAANAIYYGRMKTKLTGDVQAMVAMDAYVDMFCK